MTAEEVLVAARHRAALRVNAAAALAGVDVLALPTTACLARPYAVAETGVHIADPDGVRLLTRFAFLGNLTGLPAGSAPVGMADGLPVGLQIVGDAWDEASVLAVLAELERSGLGALDAPDGWAAML
jgi:aspartyl-tRNA(Asn)/glutamyl-tRNA(Gln) amidotransferase subunit A